MVDSRLVKQKLILFSQEMVNNKSLHEKFYNSNIAAMTSLRRGMQREDGNILKGLSQKVIPSVAKSTINGSLRSVPVPVIPRILTTFSDSIFTEAKTFFNKRNLKKAYGNDKDNFKFTIKNFEFPDIDNLRQKIDVSLRNYNDVIQKSSVNYTESINEGKVCNYHLEYCVASAQVERRLVKLIEAYSALDSLAMVLKKKILSVSNEFADSEAYYWSTFDRFIFIDEERLHKKCKYCFVKAGGANMPFASSLHAKFSSNRFFSKIVSDVFSAMETEATVQYESYIKSRY